MMRKWFLSLSGIVVGVVLASGMGSSLSAPQDGSAVKPADAPAAQTAEPQSEPAASYVDPAALPALADDGKLRIIAFGAHPDDCEIHVGGVAAMWSALGHRVKLVSVTNGDIGHWRMSGGALAMRRNAEVQRAARILGTTTRVLDIHDGELEPTLENRRTFTRLIRRWEADVVIGPRTNDYHPDHRYTGVLMQDSAFMVSVPYFCPDTPPVRRNPVFLYVDDGFQRPNPFRADIVVAIDSVIEKKVDALVGMESQFIEGGALGYLNPLADNDPAAREARRQRAPDGIHRRSANIADRFRDKLIELYGAEEGKSVRYAEAFEVCEYGRRPNKEEIKKLFPFFPKK